MHARSERPLRFWRDAQSTVLIVSLLASLLLIGGLAWQAIAASRSQYETSQQLLSDYAAVAADELMRRSTVEIGYYGVHVLMSELQRRLGNDGAGSVPNPAEFATAPDEGLRKAAGLAQRLFHAGPRTEIVPFDAQLAQVIAGLTDIEIAPDANFSVVHRAADEGHAHWLVVAKADRVGTYGLVLRPEALGDWFDRAISHGPLVPNTLGGGAIGNERLDVRVIDESDQVLFARGSLRDPHVQRQFGAEYGGLFAGMSVQVGVDPAIARQLVVGGVSPLRVPALLALFAVTVGLVIAATLLMRRERDLMRMRADFVSRVSHELRTPLAQIRLFAETLLLDRARTPEERDRCLQIVQREAIRLGHLVDNVLLFSRRDGPQEPNAPLESRKLAPLVADIIAEFLPTAREGLDLSVELDESCESTVAPDLFRQILLNLLDNAVKYGAEPITVRLTRVDGFSRLSVEDCGAGVPDADKERVWNEFVRLERDVRSAKAGTGIGLAVVRELVTAQGGRCAIHDAVTGGARVVVDLRIAGAGGA